MIETKKGIAVFVYEKKVNSNTFSEDVAELKSLCSSAGIDVMHVVTQSREAIDPKYYIGSGKVQEIAEMVKSDDIDIVVFNNSLSGSKINNLMQAVDTQVIDRCMLILDIFATRAQSREGKLQVELAQLKYSMPRLNMYANASNRYGGGVGMRGPGETKLETSKRVVEKNIDKLEQELKILKQRRDLNRQNRQKNRKPVVAIVGYTNSGKSTLLNTITKANVYARDQLFATLDTTTREVWLGEGKSVLLTDTVGFVSNLPHEFIEAFASTLDECVYADLLLHVVDISNPNHDMQARVTLDTLHKIGANAKVVTVYNKIDKLDVEKEKVDACEKTKNIDLIQQWEIEGYNASSDTEVNKCAKNDLLKPKCVCKNNECVYISASKNIGIDRLKEVIIQELF